MKRSILFLNFTRKKLIWPKFKQSIKLLLFYNDPGVLFLFEQSQYHQQFVHFEFDATERKNWKVLRNGNAYVGISLSNK